MGGKAQACQGEHFNEGALVGVDVAPGGDHENHGQGQHVEDDNAGRYRVDGPGQGLSGVLGFSCGGANQFSAQEGKDTDLEGREEAACPHGEEAAVVPEVCNGGLITVRRGKASDHHDQAHDDEKDDSHNLDEGKPELDFTKVLHTG